MFTSTSWVWLLLIQRYVNYKNKLSAPHTPKHSVVTQGHVNINKPCIRKEEWKVQNNWSIAKLIISGRYLVYPSILGIKNLPELVFNSASWLYHQVLLIMAPSQIDPSSFSSDTSKESIKLYTHLGGLFSDSRCILSIDESPISF